MIRINKPLADYLGIPEELPQTPDIDGEIEAAKKLMEWNEDRFGEPTILEYCRYYKSGVIKERHILAAIEAHSAQQITAARIDTLEKLDDWFQQYGYEVHVSHVCPQDSIDCAKFSGRSQKAHQVHKEILDRIATLKQQSSQEGEKS